MQICGFWVWCCGCTHDVAALQARDAEAFGANHDRSVHTATAAALLHVATLQGMLRSLQNGPAG
jgi:hypothetical protein